MARPDKGRRRTWRFRLNEGTILEVSAPEGPTEKQVRRRGRTSLALGTIVAAAALAAVAYADVIQGDADTVAAGNQITKSLGTVAPGAVINTSASFELQCFGNKHVDSGQSVSLTFSLAGSTVPSGGALSAANTSIGPIGTSWPDDDTGAPNCGSPLPSPIQDNGNSGIQITAPIAPGPYTYVVRYTNSLTPTGTNDPSSITAAATDVTYTLTVAAPSDNAPSVTSTTPANAATDVARDANIDITFSEAVNVTGSWFDITCGTSGNHSASVSGGSTTFTLNPGSDFAKGEVCTVTVYAANVSDQDATDPPDNMVANYVFSFTVVANVPPTAEANGPYSGNEGSAISLSSSGSTDSDGTIASYSWSYAVDTADAGASCSFSDATAANPTITCNDDGSYTVKLTVTDDDGADSAEDTATLTVSNVDPVIGSLTCPTDPVAITTPVNLTGSFTDAGTNDTHNNANTKLDWDDGLTSAGTVTEPSPPTAGSVTGSHSYAAAGIYTPSLTVTDDDGGADTESCAQYVVVYDPSAGFVTGGGWINSPAEAYAAEPTMTGKATFGFVSKYKKGATTPEGSTEFQFHAAGLNFKSTSYQWLVVSGAKATYKGVGTINGGGNYGFLLSAIDGGNTGPDKFRIKIWDKDNGDAPVYDNGLGSPDDANPTTELGGGSIVIHTGKK